MLSADAIKTAADLIWTSWTAGSVIPVLPAEVRPATRRDGYAIQAALAARGTGVIGWKIAATSKAGQTHIGVDGPIGGRLLKEKSFKSGDTVVLGANRMRFAEPEFAFRVGRDVAPRSTPYTVDEAVAAMDALLPAIEIPDSRLEQFVTAGAAQLIADNACGREFVAGAPAPETWRNVDLARHPVRADVGGRYTREGIGSNVLDDPRLALAWLVNELSSLGMTLRAGEIVTTGTCMPPLAVEPGDLVTIDFGPLGQVQARFA